jgi:hypothetical protein
MRFEHSFTGEPGNQKKHAGNHSANGQAGAGARQAVTWPRVVKLANVTVQDMEHVWDPWIPFGMVTILDGDPGLGKSTISLDLAARLTRGWDMPPAAGKVLFKPAGVLLLGAEDDLSRVVKPRLLAAGADMDQVHSLEAIVEGLDERPPVLPWDLTLVENLIKENFIRLLVVDPFMAFLDPELDAHRDQDVRRCMHRLKQLAERLGIAIFILRHLNKLVGGPALYRGGGSIGISGAGRSALVVGKHPTLADTRVLAAVKVNGAPLPRSLTYTIESAENGAASIAWGEECDLSPDDILGHATMKKKEGDRCAETIRQFLKFGPKKVQDLDGYLKASGFTPNAIKNGRRAAGVRVQRVGFGKEGEWMADLPPGEEELPTEDPFP